MPAYEISNHARPGAESRHNLAYWRYLDYAGVGPGAHGRRWARAPCATRNPKTSSPPSPATATGWSRKNALTPRRGRARGAASWACASPKGSTRGARRRLGVDRLVDEAAVDRLVGHGLLERDGKDPPRPRRAGRLLLELDPRRDRRRLESARGAGETTVVPVARDLPHFEQRSAMPSRPKRKLPSTPEKPSLSISPRSGNGCPTGQSRDCAPPAAPHHNPCWRADRASARSAPDNACSAG